MPDKFPARIPSASALLAGIVLIAGLAAGCGITESPDAESVTQSVHINLTGSVPPPDAQCNSEPTPSSFTVGPRDTATLSLAVPPGWTIRDWSCSNGICTKALVGQETNYQLRLILDKAGDPAHQSGALIMISPTPRGCEPPCISCPIYHQGPPTKPPCHAIYKKEPACCTCPCDANPGCQ